jgi:cytochrome c-type biogenesis protein CcmH/NrfG
MLAGGHLPIDGTTIDEIWQRKLTRDARPLRDFRSDLSADLEELVLRCLAREPAKRPSSAEELKKQLVAHLESARAMSNSIMGMKSPSQTEVLSERTRRRHMQLGIAAGALTAILIAGTGLLLIHRPSGPTASTVQPPVQQPSPQPAQQPQQQPAAAAAIPHPAGVPAASPAASNPLPAQPEIVPTAPAVPHPAAAHERKRLPPVLPASTPSRPTKLATPVPAEATQPAPKASPEDLAALQEQATKAVARAESAFGQGRLAAARIAATEAVEKTRKAPPDLKARAQIVMGKIELASEEFAEAERSFTRALSLDPGNPVALKGKSRAHAAAQSPP